MPSISQKQHNAMEAAAHGKSTLGIPKSVGEDFANADKGKKFDMGGPITAASIEAGGTPRQGGDGGLTGYPSPGLSNPTPASSPEIKPISTTDTPPGTGGGLSGYSPSLGGRPPFSNSSSLTPVKGGNFFKDGGMIMGGPVHDGIAMPPTAGVSSSYPPPPGQRKQGPRNYGKKE